MHTVHHGRVINTVTHSCIMPSEGVYKALVHTGAKHTHITRLGNLEGMHKLQNQAQFFAACSMYWRPFRHTSHILDNMLLNVVSFWFLW